MDKKISNSRHWNPAYFQYYCMVAKYGHLPEKRAAVQICERKMQRRILGLTLRDKTSNERLQKMANIPDAAERALMTKWKRKVMWRDRSSLDERTRALRGTRTLEEEAREDQGSDSQTFA